MERRATYAGFSAVIIFSIGTLIYAMSGAIPAFQFLAMGFLSGGLLILSYQKLRGETVLKHAKQSISTYIVVLLGIGVHNIALMLVFRSAPAFEVNVINYLWPILIVVLGALSERKWLNIPSTIGMLCGFLGMVFLFIPEQGQTFFATFERGHWLALLGAFSWAIYSVLRKNFQCSSAFLGFIVTVLGVVFLLLHLIWEQTVMPSPIMLAIILLFGFSRICYVLWDHAMQKGDRVLVAAASYFTPLLSTILFIIFGLKPNSPYIAVAGAMIILGCLAVNAPKIFSGLGRLKEKRA